MVYYAILAILFYNSVFYSLIKIICMIVYNYYLQWNTLSIY